MKKYVYILVSFIWIGCSSDFINKNPLDGATPQDYLDSEEAYRSALDGVYSTLKGDFLGYSMSFTTIPEAASDNLIWTQDGFAFDGVDTEIYPLSYDSNNFLLDGFWKISYKAIENANTIIREAQKSDNVDYEPYLGEALALRGYLHYNLYRFFAPAFIVDSKALAAPYRFENDVLEDIKPRITNDEFIENVLNDLLQAEHLTNNDVNSYRISKTAIQAILGRVYLEIGDYNQSIHFSKEALSDGRYRLESTEKGLANEWQYDESDEIIFRIRLADGEAESNAGFFAYPTFFSFPFHVPEELLNLYDRENDIRFSIYFDENPLDPGYYYPKKYVGLREVDEENFDNGKTDVKLVRLSEIYLNLSEAYARTSKNEEAIQNLNILKENRGLSDYDIQEGDLIDAILRERRRELAFEGFRFTDLKRLELGFTREDGTSMKSNDSRYALPIPQLEIDRSNIRQNPGY